MKLKYVRERKERDGEGEKRRTNIITKMCGGDGGKGREREVEGRERERGRKAEKRK